MFFFNGSSIFFAAAAGVNDLVAPGTWVRNYVFETFSKGSLRNVPEKVGRRGWDSNPLALLIPRKLLILRDATVATTATFARVGYTLGTLCLLAALFAGAISAQEQHQTFRIPFREINHRILIDVNVKGKPYVLLVDTGARVSALVKDSLCKLRVKRHHDRLGFSCDDDIATVAFQKAEVQFDGFLGADLLSKFSSVRIDYRAKTIELEQ